MSTKLKCIKCGSKMHKDGTRKGRQRYVCANANKPKRTCNYQTELAARHDPHSHDGVEPKIAERNALKMKGVKRYVITAAQNATPARAGFLAALRAFCKHRRAELIVVPYRYHNPTSHWSTAAQSQDWWAPELKSHLMNMRVPLGDHLLVLGDISIQPTASSPTSGLETMTGARSAISAHRKLELVSVPTPQQKLTKLLTTTGACTVGQTRTHSPHQVHPACSGLPSAPTMISA